MITEQTGGLQDYTPYTVTITPALTSDSFVNIVVNPVADSSERPAVGGQDVRVQEVLRLPAGETTTEFRVWSTGRDYTADGQAFAAIDLQYPTNRGCLPYTIVDGEARILVNDTSLPIPGDCDKNVRFEVDRQYFSMDEGDSVTYQMYLAGPRPTNFPVVVIWQIKNPRGYKQRLLSPQGNTDVTFTAEDWMWRNGKQVTLTISDPDNSIDGDGRVLVAHHLQNESGADPNWDSAQCLQTPEALAMTQMLVNVKDVPQTGNQQCANCGSGGDTGALKRPEPQQDGDFTEITTTTLPDAPQQVHEQPEPDDAPPARETEPDSQSQTQKPAQGLPDPQTAPTQQPDPTDHDPDQPTTRQTPQAVTRTDTPQSNEQTEDEDDQNTTLADVQAAITKHQNGEITLEELTTIIRNYLRS